MNSPSFGASDFFTSFFSEMILLNHLDFSLNEIYLPQDLSSGRGASHRLLDLEETLKRQLDPLVSVWQSLHIIFVQNLDMSISFPSCLKALPLPLISGFDLEPDSRRRQWQPTPVLLPGKSHGQRSLEGCSPWGCKESDITELLTLSFSKPCISFCFGQRPTQGPQSQDGRLSRLFSSSVWAPRRERGQVGWIGRLEWTYIHCTMYKLDN